MSIESILNKNNTEHESKIGRWVLPGKSLDELLEGALKRKDVAEAFKNSGKEYKDFKEELRYHLESSNERNKYLRSFARLIDTANKSTVPIDAVLDYFNIMGGVGSGARALLTLVRSPGYLAYDAYYLGKTHDVLGTLGNIIYEGVSWFVPGSITHLINRYTKQADKYIIEDGVKYFLEKEASSKIKKLPKEDKSEKREAA